MLQVREDEISLWKGLLVALRICALYREHWLAAQLIPHGLISFHLYSAVLSIAQSRWSAIQLTDLRPAPHPRKPFLSTQPCRSPVTTVFYLSTLTAVVSLWRFCRKIAVPQEIAVMQPFMVCVKVACQCRFT